MSSAGGEVAAAVRLAGDGLGWLTTTAEDVHSAVAARSFRAVGPVAAPVREVHDRVAAVAYGSVRRSIRAASRALAALADRHPATSAGEPLTSGPRAFPVLCAVSGILGDTLAEQHPALDVGVGWRHRGRPLPPTRRALTAAHPTPGEHLVVFVHGLCESERAWWYRGRAQRAAARAGGATRVASLGERLEERGDLSALYLRYNTGLHISEAGRRLAELLQATLDAWPRRVRSLSLVGHSMGGLVLRAACHHGSGADHRWTPRVRHVVYLGTPHLGAPLEKAVNVAGWGLDRVAESRPFARLLARRSAGVKDLRFGYVTDEEWTGHDPDELLTSRHVEVPPLAHAQHHVVTSTLTKRPTHPVGRAFGDLLVRSGSGAGTSRRRRIGFADEVVTLGGRDHFDLLTDPDVVDLLLERLDPTAPVVAGHGGPTSTERSGAGA